MGSLGQGPGYAEGEPQGPVAAAPGGEAPRNKLTPKQMGVPETSRVDLLPPGWKMQIDPKADKGEVDWPGQRLLFRTKKDMADSAIVNHEIAHVFFERTIEPEMKQQLGKEYAAAKANDPFWKKYGSDWIGKNGRHWANLAMGSGQWLNGEKVPDNLAALFEKYVGKPGGEGPGNGIEPASPRHAAPRYP